MTEHYSEAAVENDAFYCEISDCHGSYEFRVFQGASHWPMVLYYVVNRPGFRRQLQA